MTCFEDRVACGCYPMDLHDPVTNTVVWKMPPGSIISPTAACSPGDEADPGGRKVPVRGPEGLWGGPGHAHHDERGRVGGLCGGVALRENKTLDQISSASLRSCLDQKYGV